MGGGLNSARKSARLIYNRGRFFPSYFLKAGNYRLQPVKPVYPYSKEVNKGNGEDC